MTLAPPVPRRSATRPAPHSGPASPWGGLPSASRWRWAAVDSVACLALLVLLAGVLYPTYATGWLFVTVAGCGLVGLGVGLLSAWRGWGAGLTSLAATLAWFGLGTPLIMPSAGVAGVVPTLRSLHGLLTGPVTAWRDQVTLRPPIGETFNLLAVPGLLALVGALLSSTIAYRTRAATLAWVPLAVAWVVAAAFGSLAWFPLVLGALLFVVVLLWTSYRAAHLRESLTGAGRRPRPVRVALGLATLALAGIAAWAALPLMSPEAPRATVRQAVQPPIDPEQFASPLQAFRANITKHEASTLLEVSGLSEGQLVRVATMDKYDGMSFRVGTTQDQEVDETTFTRVGQWIAEDTPGQDLRAVVQVRGYTGVWVPTVGRTTGVAFDGERGVALEESFYYHHSSGTGLTTAGLREGDSYELQLRVPHRPADAEIAAAAAGDEKLPEVRSAPDQVKVLAHRWADASPTAGAQAQVVEQKLRQGYFSHGQKKETASLSGHSAARLTALVADPVRMVGDDEQYAAAMTLMMRELGVPARVVYGYRVGTGPSLTGKDVAAWTEVNLDALGWVDFHPTPDKDRVLKEEELPPPPRPRPHVENPPPPPQRPDAVPEEEELPIDPGEPPVEEEPINWAEIGAWIALTGIPVLGLVVPVTLILGLKLRRRTRRRRDPLVANRVAGAWSEVVDRARDLGHSPSVAATRSEQAEQLIDAFPRLTDKTDPVAVSRQADWVIFAPGDPSEQLAGDFWTSSQAVEKGMRRSVSWPRWTASRLSTRSFRRASPDGRRTRRARSGPNG